MPAETDRAKTKPGDVEAPLALDVNAQLGRALDRALREDNWNAVDALTARLDAREAGTAEGGGGTRHTTSRTDLRL